MCIYCWHFVALWDTDSVVTLSVHRQCTDSVVTQSVHDTAGHNVSRPKMTQFHLSDRCHLFIMTWRSGAV